MVQGFNFKVNDLLTTYTHRIQKIKPISLHCAEVPLRNCSSDSNFFMVACGEMDN